MCASILICEYVASGNVSIYITLNGQLLAVSNAPLSRIDENRPTICIVAC